MYPNIPPFLIPVMAETEPLKQTGKTSIPTPTMQLLAPSSDSALSIYVNIVSSPTPHIFWETLTPLPK